MSAETDLYAALSAAAAVTAITGSRIYPDAVPQDVKGACIAYARTGTEFETTLHNQAPYAAWATIDVVCMAATRAAADDLAVKASVAAAAAGFAVSDQRAEFDEVLGLWGTSLSVRQFSTL